jgi:hypothetical protein
MPSSQKQLMGLNNKVSEFCDEWMWLACVVSPRSNVIAAEVQRPTSLEACAGDGSEAYRRFFLSF